MRPLTTLSSLQLAAICPGSAALPKRRWHSARADLGSALHEVQEVRALGRAPDVDAIAHRWGLDVDGAEEFTALAETFRPAIPAHSLAEVALGYFEDGSVHRIVGGRGTYVGADGLLLAGTLDVMWAEPRPFGIGIGVECHEGSVLHVCDYKLTDYSAPTNRNWQLRAGALLAARWTGARRVVPAICVMTPGEGSWDIAAELGPDELDEIESELNAILRACADAREVLDVDREMPGREREVAVPVPGDGGARLRDVVVPAEGRSQVPHDRRGEIAPHVLLQHRAPRPAAAARHLVVGDHCAHCNARWTCPAAVGETRALVAAGAVPEALTRAEAARLADLIPAAKRVLETAEAALRAHVAANGPAQLASGKVYGPRESTTETWDAAETFVAVTDLVNDPDSDAPWLAMRTNKTAVGEALAEAGVAQDRVDEVRACVVAAGGVARTKGERWGVYWPELCAVRRAAAKAVRAKDLEISCSGCGAKEAEVCR